MELIPAIDLQGGRVVRLRQGDFGRVTEFGDDPVAWARRWAREGARRVHVVDLDGARSGRPVQSESVTRIAREAGIACQVAGGLRDEAAVAAALGSGAERVVLGTALLAAPALAAQLVAAHGADRIVAAHDVREGRAVGEGWRAGGPARPATDALAQLRSAGVTTFVVTAIARDGLLAGPDLALLRTLRDSAAEAAIIASGGVTSLDDVRALAAEGFAGAIVGRALYEGRLSLPAALAAAASADRSASPPGAPA